MRLRFTALIAIVAFSFMPLAFGKDEAPQSFAGRDSMNGIQLKDYVGFERNWHFVTVRYRKDTGEMRLTYANDVAWSALEQNKTNYPAGAVFAKIGIATQDDLAFPSSAVPSGARRYQFMVRDKVKYKDTDGWGYALFDPNGLTFPEDPHSTVMACAACHHIVPERGYVFSQTMVGAPFILHNPDQLNLKKDTFKFSTASFASLPPLVQGLLPKGTKQVRLLQGELRDKLFQGTLDEIRPVLGEESVRANLPTLLLSRKGDRVSIVYIDSLPDSEKNTCGATQAKLRGVTNIAFKANEKYETSFCQTRP